MGRLGMLRWDTAIARFVFGLGAILMLGSIGYGLWLLRKNGTGPETIRENSQIS